MDKKAEKAEQRNAVKEDKAARQLATKGHRLLDPLVTKFDAFVKKLNKVDGLDADTLATFETSKTMLSDWHQQCQKALGKISAGKELLRADELGFDSDKTLGEAVKGMKDIQKILNVSIARIKHYNKAK